MSIGINESGQNAPIIIVGNIGNGSSFGAVDSVSNSDTTVVVSPTTGDVIVSLPAVGSSGAGVALNRILPTQTGNSGKFLTTNGTVASWGSVSVGIITDTDQAPPSNITFDIAAASKHKVTIAGNRNLVVTNDVDGQSFIILIIQGGAGSNTVTWWSGIKWSGGTIPTLTTAVGKTDVFSFIRISSGNYLGFPVLDF